MRRLSRHDANGSEGRSGYAGAEGHCRGLAFMRLKQDLESEEEADG